MAGVLTTTGGFLLAVLWIDLIFDSQASTRGAVLDEAALQSITAYYGRATSQPMSKLIAAVMILLLSALASEAIAGDSPGWLLGLSSMLAGGPIALALTRTVPNAVRLGRRTDTPAEQSRLARAIRRDHLVCLAGMTMFLVLWLTISG